LSADAVARQRQSFDVRAYISMPRLVPRESHPP
jgi:hypothetical protein